MRIDDVEVIIPNVVRRMMNKNLIEMYKKNCRGRNIIPLSDTTLFRILRLCPASFQKSLTSLNDAATAGRKAMDDLIALTRRYKHKIQDEQLVLIVNSLNHLKDILKGKFSNRLSMEDECADHCITHALSDPLDKNHRQNCTHDHTLQCQDCQLLKDSLKAVETIIHQFSNGQERRENIHELQGPKEDIFLWKANLIQGKCQEQVQRQILNEIKKDSNIIKFVSDYACKWIPSKHREPQKEWYGKAGICWFGTSISFTKDKEIYTKTFHIFADKAVQDTNTTINFMYIILRWISA